MLSIIVAVANNNIIGCNNTMMWHLKDDLKRFKNITSNHTIIMGRKTFEALPFVLPNRKHIVITNNIKYNYSHKDVTISYDLKKVLKEHKNTPKESFIIGGGEIYEQALPYVDKIYLTRVLSDFNGDTTFNFNQNNFYITYKSDIIINNNIPFQYINYEIIK